MPYDVSRDVRVLGAVVSDVDAFVALRDEWNALQQQQSCRASSGFDHALAAWLEVAEPAGAELCILIARQGGTLVAAWGLVRHRRYFWRELQPLDANTLEDSTILRHPAADQQEILSAFRAILRQQGDVLHQRLVPHDNLAAAICTQVGLSRTRDPFSVWVAGLRDFASFEEYWQTRSKQTRAIVARRRRQLHAQGLVSLTVVVGIEERLEVLRWLFGQKLEWLDRVGHTKSWMRPPAYRHFLEHLLHQPADTSPVVMFALRLDGRIVAAALNVQDQHQLMGMVTAYAPDWSAYSPSVITLFATLHWAHAQQLNFDFRFGDEAYKATWSTQQDARTSYVVALSLRGMPPVLAQWLQLTRLRLRGRYRRARGAVLGGVIKPLLRALPWGRLPARLQWTNRQGS